MGGSVHSDAFLPSHLLKLYERMAYQVHDTLLFNGYYWMTGYIATSKMGSCAFVPHLPHVIIKPATVLEEGRQNVHLL